MSPTVIFAAGFLILFIGGGARFAIGLTFKPMVSEFGWARGELGLAVAAYLVVSAFATYIAGRLADRASPSRLLNAGVAISGIGIGLMCLVGEPWHALLLYGVVFAVGNGLASLIPVGVMVTRAFPSRTGFVNAAVISGTSVGQLVMIAALAAVLVQIGWRSVFVWLGLAHLLLIPFLVYALPRRVKSSGPAPSQDRSRSPRSGWEAAMAPGAISRSLGLGPPDHHVLRNQSVGSRYSTAGSAPRLCTVISTRMSSGDALPYSANTSK